MTVSGTYTGSPTTVEYSINGGSSWSELDAAPAGGNYTGTATLPASESDYSIDVRFSNQTGVTASVSGIANIAVCLAYGGQSNEAGRGTSNQSVRTLTGSGSHKEKTATGYANLADPTGTDGSAAGSYVPHEVNALSVALGKRIGVVNFAEGGTTIAQWQEGAGTNYYEDLATAVTAVGGCSILHMGPCESDAVAGTSEATYHSGMDTFKTSWLADFPTSKILWRTMQAIDTAAASQANQDAINDAILAGCGSTHGAATGDIANLYLSDVRSVPAYPGDTYHWVSDQQLGDIGGIQAVAVYRILNPAGGSGGTVMRGNGLGMWRL